MKSAYEDITSPKSFVHRRWEKGWLVCQCKECDLNNVYAVAVKTDETKTVQIKCNNDLSRFQLHFIKFVLTEPKLAHSLVKFPTHSISHVVMNIIMAKTGLTAIVNSAKVSSAKFHIYSNPPKCLPIKVSGHTVSGPSSTATYVCLMSNSMTSLELPKEV